MSAPPEERPPAPLDDDVEPSFGRDAPPLFEPGRAPVRGLGVPAWKIALAGLALVGLVVAGWVGPSALIRQTLPSRPPAGAPPARAVPAPRPPGAAARIHVEPFENVPAEAVLAHLERALADATALALKRQGLELSLDERLRGRAPTAREAAVDVAETDGAALAARTGADWRAAGRFERRGATLVVSVTFQSLRDGSAGLTVGVERPAGRDDELPEALAEAVGLLAPALLAPPRP